VLSKGKKVLGKAKSFEHKIHLKEDNPVYVKQIPIPEVYRDILESQIKDWLKRAPVENGKQINQGYSH
jgi:hypothetical protein